LHLLVLRHPGIASCISPCQNFTDGTVSNVLVEPVSRLDLLEQFIGPTNGAIPNGLLSVKDAHRERFSRFMGGGAVNLSKAFLQASCCSGESCLNW